MMRSLFAGVSGLKTHQTKMDVIGNNIANVNTVAYKSQNVTFQDLLYQTTQSASGANADTGRAGINAKQIGLGVKQGAINTAIATQGAQQNTGNPFDISISGDAFFIVSDGSSNFFTRAGAFTVDANGTLCMTTNGYTVQGWTNVDAQGNVQKNNVEALKIMSEENMTQDPEATKEAFLSGIIDSNDPDFDSAKGGTVSTIQFYDERGYSYTLKLATEETATPGQYNMVATDLLDADGKSMLTDAVIGASTSKKDFLAALNLFADGVDDVETASGSTGGKPNVELKYNTTTGAWASLSDTSATNKDRTFVIDVNKISENAALAGAYDIGGMKSQKIVVDVGTTKNIDNDGQSTLGGKSGNVNNSAVNAGRAVGEMDTISIQTDGKIYASYTNGVTKCLGQIAVATFANASGLEKAGENLYRATQNSGQFDGIGVDITSSNGSMSSGTLEMSNVDLSAEFTDMITTQRGFQANSRIITVSDTMLEELVNLKR